MKKSLKFLCLALTILMVLPLAFGCFGKGENEETDAETSGEAAAVFTVNGVALTDYTIVYSGKTGSGGEKAAAYLNGKLQELYGIALTMEPRSQADRYEILLGLDGGEATIIAANKENAEGLIAASGKKVAVMGPNYEVLHQGIDALLAKATQTELTVSGNEFLNAKSFSLKVMTYNVCSTSDGRVSDYKARMVATILENNVDVLGTQEDSADNSAFFLEEIENYDLYKGEFEGNGSYIYWRKDKFNVVKKSYLFLSDTPVTPSKLSGASGNITMSYVVLEDKETAGKFLVVNAQADEKANDKVRGQQMKIVAEQLAKINKDNLPVVILGDFDTSATELLAQNKSFALASKVADSKGDSKGTLVNDFAERDKKTVHDYIIVNTDRICTEYYTVVDNATDGTYPSDHLPVLAKVKLY